MFLIPPYNLFAMTRIGEIMDRCTRFKHKILSLTQQMVEDQRHSVKSEVSCGICCAGWSAWPGVWSRFGCRA
jgi:hypothetical protein